MFRTFVYEKYFIFVRILEWRINSRFIFEYLMDGKPLLGMDSRRVLFLNICVILERRIILLVLFSNI